MMRVLVASSLCTALAFEGLGRVAPRSALGTGLSSRPRSQQGSDERSSLTEDEDEGAAIAAFRARLIIGGLDAVATEPVGKEAREKAAAALWARRSEKKPVAGTVLVGNEDFFFGKDTPDKDREAALTRVGLPADAHTRLEGLRRTQLLPVCLVVDDTKGHSAVLCGRRSGYLMGDLPDIDTAGFRVQPLYFGGPSKPSSLDLRTVGTAKGAGPTGILAVHPYGTVDKARQLTADGLYVGGDWASTKTLVQSSDASAFRFQLFIQSVSWEPGALEREIAAGAWSLVDCSTELLLKERDRTTPTLWADINEELLPESEKIKKKKNNNNN